MEILVSFGILLIAILTLVGYTTTIHRAAKEGKRQALASAEARTLVEKIRDYPVIFEQAATPAGYTETRTEYLLDGESNPEDNEVGREAATNFLLLAKAEHVIGEIYAVVVTVEWEEEGRLRQVKLENRMERMYR